MKYISAFAKKEYVLIAAIILAAVSMICKHPDVQYFSYIDFSMLGVLFCLMAVVAGFMDLGIFDLLSEKLIVLSKNARWLAVLLVNCVFLSSMFVTNDVALIAFVPITIGIFNLTGREKLIFLIVMETIAANIGSMLTPIGNPQNLYLYSFYHMDILDFLKIVVPTGMIGYIIVMGIVWFVLKDAKVEMPLEQGIRAHRGKKLYPFFTCLFVLCVLTVLHAVDYKICVLTVLITILTLNRTLLKKIDYSLLLTFVSFFIFAGNIERIDIIKTALSYFITGRAFLLSVVSSQVISNVPAAIMVSRFTGDARGVLLGVSIGGLGTPVASLASLISFKLYSRSARSAPGKYLRIFSLYNISILIFLTAAIFLYMDLRIL